MNFDHPAAHEYLADLALEAGRLAELEASSEAADLALRAHIDECATCRAEVAELSRIQQSLTQALAGAAVDPEALPPPALRERLLGSVAGQAPETSPRLAGQRPGRFGGSRPVGRVVAGLAAAIAVVVLIGGAWLISDQQARLELAAAETQPLAELADVLGRVVTTTDHQAVVLLAADGASAGTLAWTRREIVVLSRALGDPGDGHVYRCWVARDGETTAVGRLYFAGGWSYWAGSTDSWAAIDLRPGGRFIVSLDQAGQPADRPSGPIVLHADLGS